MSLLSIHELSVAFRANELVTAVKHVSFSIKRKEILALVGETGCGKSVIAHAIMRILPDEAAVTGSIMFNGQDIFALNELEMSSVRGNKIAIVFQNPSLSLNPVHRIGMQVAEPLQVHKGTKKAKALEMAAAALFKSGFPQPDLIMRLYPGECSGGMNQRALIAASVITGAELLIADEPTKGLDADLVSYVKGNLRSIREQEGASMLLITHDLHVAHELADRVAIMYAGEIVELVSAEHFFDKALHPYSQALLQSLPENGFIPIRGESISITGHTNGCSFHPRCPHSTLRCTKEQPSFFEKEGRNVRCFLYC